MKVAVILALGLLAGRVAYAAETPQTFTLTQEQMAFVIQTANEKRAAAMTEYNKWNDLIAAVQKQLEGEKEKSK